MYPLLSPPGGLFNSSKGVGGLIRGGGALILGGIISLVKMMVLILHKN